MAGVRRRWNSFSFMNDSPYARNMSYHFHLLFSWLNGEKPIKRCDYGVSGRYSYPYSYYTKKREGYEKLDISESLSKDLTEFTIDNFRNCPSMYKGDMKRNYYALLERQRRQDRKTLNTQETRIRNFVYKQQYPKRYAQIQRKSKMKEKSKRSFCKTSLLKGHRNYNRYALITWLCEGKPLTYTKHYPSQHYDRRIRRAEYYLKRSRIGSFTKNNKLGTIKSYKRYVLMCWLENRKPKSQYYFAMNDINVWGML